jgi:hypothetical protein
VRPPPHPLVVHWPFEHSAPPVHCFPHAPQLFGSLDSSTHVPLHDVSPPVHPHLPALHVVPPVHATPHAPQFASSVFGSTHALPH